MPPIMQHCTKPHEQVRQTRVRARQMRVANEGAHLAAIELESRADVAVACADKVARSWALGGAAKQAGSGKATSVPRAHSSVGIRAAVEGIPSR